MIKIDLCYIMAIVLSYMKKIRITDLERICAILNEEGYEIDISYEKIYYTINEWKDFFELQSDSLVLKADSNIISKIFINTLDHKTKSDIFNAMIYRSKQR